MIIYCIAGDHTVGGSISASNIRSSEDHRANIIADIESNLIRGTVGWVSCLSYVHQYDIGQGVHVPIGVYYRYEAIYNASLLMETNANSGAISLQTILSPQNIRCLFSHLLNYFSRFIEEER